jgi:hypothetical protein
MAARVIEARGDEPPHAEIAHVAERHRWAGRVVAHSSEQSPHVLGVKQKALSATGPSWSHGERPRLRAHLSLRRIKISGCELGHITLSGIWRIYLYPFLDIRCARKRASVSNLEGR